MEFLSHTNREYFLDEIRNIHSYLSSNRLKKEIFNNNETKSDKLFTFNSGDLDKLTNDESYFKDYIEYSKNFYILTREFKNFKNSLGPSSFFTLVIKRLFICEIEENPYIVAFKELVISHLIKNFNKYVYE